MASQETSCPTHSLIDIANLAQLSTSCRTCFGTLPGQHYPYDNISSHSAIFKNIGEMSMEKRVSDVSDQKSGHDVVAGAADMTVEMLRITSCSLK